MHSTWTTRAETGADRHAVHDIVRAAFGRPAEADLVDAPRDDPARLDGLSLLATDAHGTPVGHALLTRAHIDDVPALCLGPVAVLPGHQRACARSAAVRAALRAAGARGEHHVVVLGHPAY